MVPGSVPGHYQVPPVREVVDYQYLLEGPGTPLVVGTDILYEPFTEINKECCRDEEYLFVVNKLSRKIKTRNV